MENKNKNFKTRKGDLMQILVCIIMIGILLLIEGWLLFYYNGGFIFPLIFGILLIMMFCLHTINMYQFFERKMKSSAGGEKKAELLIYKKVKSLPDELEEIIQNQIETNLSNIEKNQIKTSKAVLKKTEELINELKAQNENLSEQLQTALDENAHIKEMFEELKNEQQKMTASIENLNLKNEEMPIPVPELEAQDETADSKPDEMVGSESEDANRQLSPEEIASLFANV